MPHVPGHVNNNQNQDPFNPTFIGPAGGGFRQLGEDIFISPNAPGFTGVPLGGGPNRRADISSAFGSARAALEANPALLTGFRESFRPGLTDEQFLSQLGARGGRNEFQRNVLRRLQQFTGGLSLVERQRAQITGALEGVTAEEVAGFNLDFILGDPTGRQGQFPGLSNLIFEGGEARFAQDIDPTVAQNALDEYRNVFLPERDQAEAAEAKTREEAFTEDDVAAAQDRFIEIDSEYEGRWFAAARDWDSFLDTPFDPADAGSPTWRELYQTVLPEIDQLTGNITPTGDLTDQQMASLMDGFAEWKANPPTEEEALSEEEQAISDTATDAITEAVEAFSAGDIGSFFNQAQTEELRTGLLENIRTREEIETDFEGFFAPEEQEFRAFGVPEARAIGTEAAGGLGSGVQTAQLRAQAAHTASRSGAFAQYFTAATQANLGFFDQALKFATTPADLAETYSRIGQNLVTTQAIQSQAANATYSVELEAAALWGQLGLTDANIDLLAAQADLIDTETLFNLYKISAAEGGFDANILAQLSNWYMSSQAGALGNPLLSTIMALTDMQTTNTIVTPGTSGILGDIFGAAGAFFGSGGFKDLGGLTKGINSTAGLGPITSSITRV